MVWFKSNQKRVLGFSKLSGMEPKMVLFLCCMEYELLTNIEKDITIFLGQTQIVGQTGFWLRDIGWQ